MEVEQYVMAYHVEQDRLRAMLPEGFVSLRQVLRFNGEVRREDGTERIYLELNTPVAAQGKRGWLNIAHWESTEDDLTCRSEGRTLTFQTPFLTLSFTAVGVQGGCPAERDNDGCFYPGGDFVPAEQIDSRKEFCDCEFAWRFAPGDARGASTGETLPAFPTAEEKTYPKAPLTAREAASIPCDQVLGSYTVRFHRERRPQ